MTMILQSAVLKNFCQHKNLEMRFVPGTNCLCGPNGCGKSNALYAIQLAIFGQAHERVSYADLVTQGCEDQDCSIEVTLSRPDRDENWYLFRRFWPTTKSRFSISQNGSIVCEYQGQRSVHEALESRYQMTVNQLLELCMVGQGKITSFADMTPSELQEFLVRLLHLDTILKIRENIFLGYTIQSIDRPDLQVIEQRIDSINNQIKNIELTINQQYSDLHQNRSIEDYPEYQIVKLYEQCAELKKRYQEIAQDRCSNELILLIRHLYNRIDLQTSIVELQKRLSSIETVYHEKSRLLHERQVKARLYEKYYQIQSEVNRLNQEYYRLLQSRPQEPVVDISWDKHQAFYRLYELIQEIYQLFEQFFNDITYCPLCHQKVDHLDRLLPEWKLQFSKQLDQWRNENQKFQEYLQRKQELQQYDAKLAEVVQQLQKAQDALKQLSSIIEEPISQQDNLSETVHLLHKELLSTRSELLQYYRRYQETEVGIQISLDRLIEGFHELKIISHHLTKYPNYSYEEYILAKQKVDDYLSRHKTYTELTSRLSVLREELDAYRQRHQQLSEVRKFCDTLDNIRSVWTTATKILSKSEFPAFVLNRVLKDITQIINFHLEKLDAPFRLVDLLDDFKLRVQHLRSRWTGSSTRLSGGEKVFFGIAWVMSFRSLLKVPLDVVILDEPFIGLDENNLSLMELFMDRVRYHCGIFPRQILIVTHRPIHQQLIDHLITLGV